MTFQEVTQPYLKAFGKPDQIVDLELTINFYRQWYYYKDNVIVEFVCPKDNTKDEWEVSYAMCLDPLKYRNDKKSDL